MAVQSPQGRVQQHDGLAVDGRLEHRRSGRSVYEAGTGGARGGKAVQASADKRNAASQYKIGELAMASAILVEESADEALTDSLLAAGVTVLRA